MKKWVSLWIACCLFASLLAACGNEASPNSEADSAVPKTPVVSTKPVTLTAFVTNITVPEELSDLLTNEVKNKYPYITLNFIAETKDITLESLISAGTIPDFIVTFIGYIPRIQPYGLLYDMTPMLKSHQYDMGRFQDVIVKDMKKFGENGAIYGLPFNYSFHALYYNKDLFDKFGVPYPKDGMSWNDTIELGRKMTRTEQGVQYRGLDPQNIVWVGQALSLVYVDPKTDKASINNDSWKKVFELMRTIYSIPGNEPINTGTTVQFTKDQTLAMMGSTNQLAVFDKAAADTHFNWDVAQYPSFPERPNTFGNASVQLFLLSRQSQYKDQAMQALEVITSDSVQETLAKQTYISPLKSPDVQKLTGAGLASIKGKNITGIFKSHPVDYLVTSKYQNVAVQTVNKKLPEYYKGTMDVNTLLRELDADINQAIEAQK